MNSALLFRNRNIVFGLWCSLVGLEGRHIGGHFSRLRAPFYAFFLSRSRPLWRRPFRRGGGPRRGAGAFRTSPSRKRQAGGSCGVIRNDVPFIGGGGILSRWDQGPQSSCQEPHKGPSVRRLLTRSLHLSVIGSEPFREVAV